MASRNTVSYAPFWGNPGRGPPRNRPHFWYGKLEMSLWGAAKLIRFHRHGCNTQSASCGCISITKPKSEGTPRAMSCHESPRLSERYSPSGFARTIARAEIHGAQSYARTVRTLDILWQEHHAYSIVARLPRGPTILGAVKTSGRHSHVHAVFVGRIRQNCV